MAPQDDLLAEVLAFMAKHGLAASTFGLRALNDPGFVRGLQKGRRVWPETATRVRAFMAAYEREPYPGTTPIVFVGSTSDA
jgi:hypothetical protein